MARPIADKYVMRTPEEKEHIVLEALERGTKRTAEARGVDRRLLQRWIAKYRADGVDGLRSRSGKCGGGNPLAELQNKKNKTREEELELENLIGNRWDASRRRNQPMINEAKTAWHLPEHN